MLIPALCTWPDVDPHSVYRCGVIPRPAVLTVGGHDEQLRRVPVGGAVGGGGRPGRLAAAGGVRPLQAVVQLVVTDLQTAQGSIGRVSLLS